MSRELRLRLVAAFAAVYVVWGSTYLAIRFAIETIPPFLMAGTRFVLAGALMTVWARWRGAAWPSAREWGAGAVIGLLMLLGGNGGVTWAELYVPSSLAALVVGAVPLWVVLLEWLRPGGQRPQPAVIAGLVTGFAGLALLVAPTANDAARVDVAGAAVLLLATVLWAAGSIYSRHTRTASSPIMATGVNMLAGGAGLLLAALVAGEPARFALAAVSLRSFGAWAYLVVFGSIMAFTAYIWLLRNTAPAKAATYAYVNPVIAVLLGWALASEPVTPRVLVAAAIIIAGVVSITSGAQLRVVARRLRLGGTEAEERVSSS